MTFVHFKAKTENVYVMNNLYLEVSIVASGQENPIMLPPQQLGRTIRLTMEGHISYICYLFSTELQPVAA